LKTTISKRFTFCAGHRLYNPALTDDKNLEVYGECSNPNGHGHNFILEVSLSGSVDPVTGMIMNLKDLKNLIEAEIINKVDHKNLNLDVDFMNGVIPTTEMLAAKIWAILDGKIGGNLLAKVVLWESENNRFEVSR
jgi:6-pyruvoyltetrahydropterin/6-carboxytetrahydropterin synthase